MNREILRILDANANRAREALRVIEDYARFVLDDSMLCAELKALRHNFSEATRAVADDAILNRDTPGDVGTGTKTSAELTRDDVSHVVTAAGKRCGEALRTIEEYLKTLDPDAASRVESIRYRFYDFEHRLAFTLRPATSRFADVRLYVLLTESVCKRPWLEVAEQSIVGGADCIQLREKSLDSGELLARARQLVELCRRHRVLCIINDRPDIALASGADGVHVGQQDLPARDVRKLVGMNRVLGVSTHSIEQARQAVLDGADYIGVGPVFRSATKPRDFLPGLDYARQVAEQVKIPAVAIAGIDAANVDEVLGTGLRAVAVCSAVIAADDVRAAARTLKEKLAGQTGSSAVGQTFLSASASGNPRADPPVDLPDKNVRQTQAEMPAPPTQLLQRQASTAAPLGGSTDEPDIPVCPAEQNQFVPWEGTVHVRRRRLPHWTMRGATYFVTFRIAHGELSEEERLLVLDHIRSGNGKFYELLAAVIMPDHGHALLRPLDGIDLTRVMRGIKGVSARLINERRGTAGPIWQPESWDRILRDQAEFDERLQYIFNNAAKKELVAEPWDYEALYIAKDVGA